MSCQIRSVNIQFHLAMKRKNKSQHSNSATKLKRRKQSIPSQEGAFADSATQTVSLGLDQVASFVGTAQLTVLSGTVWIAGKTLTAGDSAVLLADAWSGGPMAIEAAQSNGTLQVPLAAQATSVLEFGKLPEGHQALPGHKAAVFNIEVVAEGSTSLGQPQTVPQQWRQVASELSDVVRQGACPVAAVCGSKGTGKSTMARLLCNALLDVCPCVGFLETDCGQAEHTVPGLVSLTYLRQPLFGPPFMRQLQPARAFFIGDTSPQSDPVRFVSAVEQLCAWHWDRQQHSAGSIPVPLVVNTAGWVKGLGFDVLAEVLRCVGLTHMVQLQAANQNRNLPAGAFWLPEEPREGQQQAPVIYQMPAITTPDSVGPLPPAAQAASSAAAAARGPTPSEARSLQWLAFAAACLGCSPACLTSSEMSQFPAAAAGLAGLSPYAVLAEHVQLQWLHSAVALDHQMEALNGAVVGLCSAAPQHEGTTSQAADLPHCQGVGVVRTADAGSGHLLVLTPLQDEQLQEVDVLQVGRLELPAKLLQAPGLMTPYISAWSITADGTGAAAIKARNNLLRARMQPT